LYASLIWFTLAGSLATDLGLCGIFFFKVPQIDKLRRNEIVVYTRDLQFVKRSRSAVVPPTSPMTSRRCPLLRRHTIYRHRPETESDGELRLLTSSAALGKRPPGWRWARDRRRGRSERNEFSVQRRRSSARHPMIRLTTPPPPPPLTSSVL